MNKQSDKKISVIKGVEVIALVVEYGLRHPFLQWRLSSHYASRGSTICSVRLLERVLSGLSTGDKADLHIKNMYAEAEGLPTLVDFIRHGDTVGEKRKVKLPKGMTSLLDLIQHERLEKRRETESGGRRLNVTFWESCTDRVKLVGKVIRRGEEGLKSIDRTRTRLLKESIERGKWH